MAGLMKSTLRKCSSLVVLSLVMGCISGGDIKAVRSLTPLTITAVENLRVTEETATGRVLLEWPGTVESPCVERLNWASGQHRIEAVADGPCAEQAAGSLSQQWLQAEVTTATLKMWLSGELGGFSLPVGSTELHASVAGRSVQLQAKLAPELRLAEDLAVGLAGGAQLRAAALRPASLFPPVVELTVWVRNPVAVDLRVVEASYALRTRSSVIVSGPLRVPELLSASRDTAVTVRLDALKVPGTLLQGAGALLHGESLAAVCSITLRTPWGRAVVEASLPVELR